MTNQQLFDAITLTNQQLLETVTLTTQNQFVDMENRLQGQIREMDARFKKRFEEMDAKFEKRFEEMDAKFEKRFEEMDAKFDNLAMDVKGVHLYLENNINKRLSNIESIYLDTYKRYQTGADRFEQGLDDIEQIKRTVATHSVEIRELKQTVNA